MTPKLQIILIAALLSACVTPSDPSIIGWMSVDGPEGHLNQQLVTGDHIAIHSGDHVATGRAGTGIRVMMRGWGAGYVQLDKYGPGSHLRGELLSTPIGQRKDLCHWEQMVSRCTEFGRVSW